MAEATRTRAKSPNGRAAQQERTVGQRVGALRRKAKSNPEAAREEAWGWIAELGRRAVSDREAALAELQALFEAGKPAYGIEGQTEGILVTWTMNPVVDKLIGSVTNAWMPWLGKKFFPDRQQGVNTLTDSARWASKLLWPFYSMRESSLGRSAFDFTTYVEAGKLDPSVDVLVIDYGSISANPRLLIRQIRDELVQIVPGANLGKMLVSVPGRGELFAALYFALKSDI